MQASSGQIKHARQFGMWGAWGFLQLASCIKMQTATLRVSQEVDPLPPVLQRCSLDIPSSNGDELSICHKRQFYGASWVKSLNCTSVAVWRLHTCTSNHPTLPALPGPCLCSHVMFWYCIKLETASHCRMQRQGRLGCLAAYSSCTSAGWAAEGCRHR